MEDILYSGMRQICPLVERGRVGRSKHAAYFPKQARHAGELARFSFLTFGLGRPSISLSTLKVRISLSGLSRISTYFSACRRAS